MLMRNIKYFSRLRTLRTWLPESGTATIFSKISVSFVAGDTLQAGLNLLEEAWLSERNLAAF